MHSPVQWRFLPVTRLLPDPRKIPQQPDRSPFAWTLYGKPKTIYLRRESGGFFILFYVCRTTHLLDFTNSRLCDFTDVTHRLAILPVCSDALRPWVRLLLPAAAWRCLALPGPMTRATGLQNYRPAAEER